MIKKLTVEVPVHLRKFFMAEYDGVEVQKGAKTEYVINVEKSSEVGKLIHLIARPIPFTQERRELDGSKLSILYYTREKAYEVPVDKLKLLSQQLDEIFRRTLICEVRSVHEITGSDYSPHVKRVLERRGIMPDVDIDFQTARKVYRDYLEKNARKNQKIYA